MSATDYDELYADYWSRVDRWGSHSFDDPEDLAREVIDSCGGGRLLDVGCGMGALVRTLLRSGVDANGLDVSERVVEHNNSLAPGRFKRGSMLDIPHEDGAFETVLSTDVLEHLAEEDVPRALGELARVSRRYAYIRLSTAPDRDLKWHLTVQPRGWWERQFFAAGFRQHPLALSVVPFEQREGEGAIITLLLEKLPVGVLEAWPPERLEAQRMLHMDMLRDTGRRADAHIARYDLARQLVRPGDVVLDVACGLGYGSAILAAGSPASRVIGVDESEYAIDYARAAYARPDGPVEYRRGDALALEFLPDASVDLVVSFETLEHVHEPDRLLAEFQRVLRPAGRVMVSVPNDWSDESGEDPNPHHHHVYDWAKLASQLGEHFRLERAWAQTAGGAAKLTDGRRELYQVPLDPPPERDSEWWLASALKDPVGADPAGYRETSFATPADPEPVHVTAFGRDYDDPWLVKGMVSIGMRSENPADLRAMASEVLAGGRAGSADVGAAICVLAYDRLARPSGAGISRDELLARIARYHEEADGTPNSWRWRVSNQFAAALLLRAVGRRAEASAAFVACSDMDCLRYAPILATKSVDASYQAGLMAVFDGHTEGARALFAKSVRLAREALGTDWGTFLGDLEHPIVFGLPEASQVLDLAGRAAYALESLERWNDRPGWSTQRSATGVGQQRKLLKRQAQQHEEQARRFFDSLGAVSAELAAVNAHSAARSAEQERELRSRQGRLNGLEVERDQLAGELARITSSRSWRAMARINGWRDRLLPRGSRRRRLVWKLFGRAGSDPPDSAAPELTLRALVPAPLKPALRKARTKARDLRSGLRERANMRDWERLHPALAEDGRRVVALQLGTWDKGGVEEVVLSLARNLQRDPGLHVVVFVAESGLGHLGQVARDDGIHVVSLDEDKRFLRWLIQRLGVQVVNLHYSVFGYEEYERAGVPMVYTVHNTYIWAGPDMVAERREPFSKVARFLAVSNAVRDFFVRRFEIDPERVTAVPNGLDLDFVAAAEPVERAELGLSDDDVVFLNIASFNINKFHILMVAAMERVVRELPNAKLLFVGNTLDPRCRAYIEAEIERRGLSDCIRILEFVPKGRVMGLMRMADCFLLPSLIEGWSIAVMEAMYSELPMILSDVGSARDVIDDEDIGIVVRNPFPDIAELTTDEVVQRYVDDSQLDNLDDLVAAMLRFGADVPGWAARARAARVKIESRYTAAHMGAEYAACFAQVAVQSETVQSETR